MTEETGTATEGVDNAQGDGDTQQQGQSVPQAEVDRIVRERVARERAKYADYDELKAKAEGSRTLEQRLADLETELTTTKAKALKTSVAAKFGISTEPGPKGEPSDADLFLTGSDEATLTAQAQRLAARVADQKKQGNVALKEGTTTTSGKGDDDMREFARNLFANAD